MTSFLIFIIIYWENLLKVLMRSNNRIFYILFYFIANFKQVFTMFKSFDLQHWNGFLANIVNKA